MPAAAIASAAAGLLGGMFGSSSQSRQLDRQLKMQREENALNRQFNHDEAELARQFQQSVIDQQNEYNSASSQLKRLQEAGLNPNLMYSGTPEAASAGSGTSVQSASSNGSISPVGLTQRVNLMKELAETDLLKAQANKVDSERELTDVEVRYADALKQGELRLQDADIGVKITQGSLNEQEAQTLAKQAQDYVEKWKLYKTEMQERLSNASLNNLVSDYQSIKNFYASKEFEVNIAKIAADANLSIEKAKGIYKLMTSAAYLNSALSKQSISNSNLLESEKIGQDIENGISSIRHDIESQAQQLGLQLDIIENERNRGVFGNFLLMKEGNYYDVNQWLNGINSVINSASGVMDIIPLPGKPPKAGFVRK